MSDATRLFCLRIALVVFGLIMIFAIYPLYMLWPSGWAWGHSHSHYIYMIIGIYATLGVFLLLAAKTPDAHRSLIWFTVWSSVVHGGIMAYQAVTDPMEHGHLLTRRAGTVPDRDRARGTDAPPESALAWHDPRRGVSRERLDRLMHG